MIKCQKEDEDINRDLHAFFYAIKLIVSETKRACFII